jgi:hypothetical protein
MRYSKLLLIVVGATVLLGALVASTSARTLSSSTQSISSTWTRWNYTSGFGTTECELVLSERLHSGTIAKVVNSLVGYVTAANIPACRRGGLTVLRETLPWHLTYRGFTGTLPNITTFATNVLGTSIKLREPTFGATCLARSSAASPNILTYSREAGGRLTSTAETGTIPCTGAINVTLAISGTSSSVSAVTVTLI